MKIGVLALQGAFAEHEKVLEQLMMHLYCRVARVPFRESF